MAHIVNQRRTVILQSQKSNSVRRHLLCKTSLIEVYAQKLTTVSADMVAHQCCYSSRICAVSRFPSFFEGKFAVMVSISFFYLCLMGDCSTAARRLQEMPPDRPTHSQKTVIGNIQQDQGHMGCVTKYN